MHPWKWIDPEHVHLFPVLSHTARFMFNGVEVPEHSLVVRETVGSADADTLMCETDYSPCCTDTENGWFFPFDNLDGDPFPVPALAGWSQTRLDTGVVRLEYTVGTVEGIFYCQIRVSAAAGDLGLPTLYVGVYPSVTDGGGDGKSV